MESQWYLGVRALFSTGAIGLLLAADGSDVGEDGGEGVGDNSLVVLRTTLLPATGDAGTSDAMGATGRAVLGTVGGEGGGDGVLSLLLAVLPAPAPGACEAAYSSLRTLIASFRSVLNRSG
jgi:hypothetical protein